MKLVFDTAAEPQTGESCIHTLFAQQVQRTPDAPALVWSEGTLTYRQLNCRANQVAHHLQALGVAGGDCVAVCLERSPEMIVALLAILKAGGAYVPLERTYPTERLALMLADTGASVILTRAASAHELPTAGRRIVCLETEADAVSAQPTHDLNAPADGEALAYVMYTSGSTGRPKGVLAPHRGVARLVRNPDYVSISAADVFLQFAPITFDASTFEIWGSLLNGASLVLFPPYVPGTRELGEFIRQHEISVLWLTASLFHLMVDEQVHNLRGVRQLLAGGDVLAVASVRRFLAAAPGCVLINGYGPTENTTFTTCCRIQSEEDLATTVPIGRAISGTCVYVLDASGLPVAEGEAGELLTGGEGLSLGYLNLPDLTAERFVPDPFCGEAGQRLYRTGDLVRPLPDGRLEFIGRMDQQVKVRGYRIEPGEIEAALALQPGVREAVVLAREEPHGDRCLVAYVAIEAGAEVAASLLRQGLRRSLPDHLIPTTFVLLSALPLTPHGKVDRAALMAHDITVPVTVNSPLRTPIEELLAGVWSDVLQVPKVEADADFFGLGGNSLRAMQVASRVDQALGINFTLRALFEFPILQRLAAHIEARGGGQSARGATRLTRSSDEPVLSPCQQWLGHACWKEPDSATYNIPYLLNLSGSLDVGALQSALQQVVMRHEPFRYQFSNAGPNLVTAIREPGPLLIPLHDLAHFPPAERERLARGAAATEARRPFKLGEGRLLRARLWRLDHARHLLLLTIHHLAFDGWSLAVLADELSRGYNAALREAAPELPDLPIRYRDYAWWRSAYATSEDGLGQYDYWNRHLADVPELLNLPLDGARTAFAGDKGAIVELIVDTELRDRLDLLARNEAATRFMVLLAAWNVVLLRWSGQQRFAVWTPVAGRVPETEGLIGYFVNVLPLCVDFTGNPSYRSLVRAIRDTTLDAFANQDVSAEHFQRIPRLQTLFVLQNAPVPKLGLMGIEADVERLSTDTAKFELSLELDEQDQRLCGGIEFNPDLFHPQTVRALAADFVTVLTSMVDGPEQAVQPEDASGPAGHDQDLVAVAADSFFQTESTPPESGSRRLQAGVVASERQANDPATVSAGNRFADDIERRLAECWARLLHVTSVSPTDDFFALGGHSLLAVRLLGEIEREFGRRLSLGMLLRAPTVRQMSILLGGAAGDAGGWSALVPLQTSGELPPLFCAPVAGGSAFYYRALAAELAPLQPLYTFEPRGMSGVLPPHETVEEMAAYYVEQMRRVQPQGPYALAGLSFGGVIAFEMARQLHEAGDRVAPVLLFDAWAPVYVDRMMEAHAASGRMFRDRARFAFGFHWENLAACPNLRERLVYVRDRAHKLRRKLAQRMRGRDGSQDRLNPASIELPELFRQVAEAEARARAIYRPGPSPVQVRLLRARLQTPGLSAEPMMGWQEFAAGGVEVVVVPGTHYSLLEQPCVRVTAARVRRMLAEKFDCNKGVRRKA